MSRPGPITFDTSDFLQTVEIAATTCDENIIRILAQDKNWYIRLRVAENESINKDIQSILLLDPDINVLQSLANNPVTCDEIQTKLVDRETSILILHPKPKTAAYLAMKKVLER